MTTAPTTETPTDIDEWVTDDPGTAPTRRHHWQVLLNWTDAHPQDLNRVAAAVEALRLYTSGYADVHVQVQRNTVIAWADEPCRDRRMTRQEVHDAIVRQLTEVGNVEPTEAGWTALSVLVALGLAEQETGSDRAPAITVHVPS